MTDATRLIEMLKVLKGSWIGDGIHPSIATSAIIAALEQQAAQIEALQLTKAGLIGSLREEMDEGLRLRELGGALPDENITAMTERLIGERAALAAELSALRADAELMTTALNKIAERQNSDWPDRCQALVNTARAALRQEQPT